VTPDPELPSAADGAPGVGVPVDVPLDVPGEPPSNGDGAAPDPSDADGGAGADVPVELSSDADGEPDEPNDEEELAAPVKARRGLRALLPSPVWKVGRLLLLALIIEYFVVPQLAGPRKVIDLVTQVNPFLLIAGVALEVAAWVCYSQLTRTVLPNGRDLPWFRIFRINMTTLSLSHCAPGGSATGAALNYRLLTRSGMSRSDVGFALGTQAIGSAMVLNIILWLALIVSIPVWGFSAVYLIAGIVGLALLASAGTLLILFTRGEERVGAFLERAASRIAFIDGVALRRSFEHVAGRLRDLGRRRRLLLRAGACSMGFWLCDAGALAVFVGAFGHWVNPDGLLVAYGVAYVVAAIPITPGGLGVVEVTLTSILVGFGTPRGIATLGVVAYRLINFWLPIPLGGLAYVSLHVNQNGGRLRRVREVDGSLAPLESPFRLPWRRVSHNTQEQ
jgi:uncharacterized protein (TIRG00374 family)